MILKVILLLTNIISVSSTSWCDDSPMQMCFVRNQAVNQCAYREGNCCNYNCKSFKCQCRLGYRNGAKSSDPEFVWVHLKDKDLVIY